MAKLTRLYTRKGDRGSTRLATGREVEKDSLRVEAYGAVDELNAQLGVVLAAGPSDRVGVALQAIQNRLFDVGAHLATPPDDEVEFELPSVTTGHVRELEELIDQILEIVGPLDNFILPGGAQVAAALHVARTVCRRAERRVVALSRVEPVGDQMLPYLNRLSDTLFVMARHENSIEGCEEPLWMPGG